MLILVARLVFTLLELEFYCVDWVLLYESLNIWVQKWNICLLLPATRIVDLMQTGGLRIRVYQVRKIQYFEFGIKMFAKFALFSARV